MGALLTDVYLFNVFSLLQDHTKIIICPLMSVVSYISDDKSSETSVYHLSIVMAVAKSCTGGYTLLDLSEQKA